MKKTGTLVFIFVFALFKAVCYGNFLDENIPVNNKRYRTFALCLDELERRGAKVIVETGTSRNGKKNCLGDGCSTCIFSNWAFENNGTLFSVDISRQALKEAENALGIEKSSVFFVEEDSIEFLQNFEGEIDFLYLDSFDFDKKNPKPSQLHHLKEIQAALPHLSPEGFVMIDDCLLPFGGKGALVIEFLKSKGWEVLFSGYQVIMTPGKSHPSIKN